MVNTLEFDKNILLPFISISVAPIQADLISSTQTKKRSVIKLACHLWILSEGPADQPYFPVSPLFLICQSARTGKMVLDLVVVRKEQNCCDNQQTF